ncbi:MAG: hypothetical protein ACK5U7_16340, partial [Bacteroidota bacterium]
HEVQEPFRDQANGLLIEYYIQDKNKINQIIIVEIKRLPEKIKVVHENGATHQQGQKTQHGVLNLIK